MGFERILYYLREYFFPSGCGGCGEALLSTEDAYTGLCGNCRAVFQFAYNEKNRCRYCGRQLISEIDHCLSCRQKEAGKNERFNKNLVKIIALFPYSGKFRFVLSAYKFGKMLGTGNFLSRFLILAQEDLDEELDIVGTNVAWVPVPPRPRKIMQHGWDQIEFLAGRLERARKSGAKTAPVCRCLKRLPSKSQKELNRDERETNLKGKIACIKQPPKTAILFDDVITTGATLGAALKLC